MILIKRISDGEIMNDRQLAAWPKEGKLAELQERVTNSPKNTDPSVKARFQEAIDMLQADKAAWYDRRKQAVCAMFGGVPSGYDTIEVPKEDEFTALTARYIEEIDGILVYYNGPEYSIVNSSLVVNHGWVKGNYRLIDSDVTNFSSLTLVEPLYFALVYAQNNVTEVISVQLLTRAEDEEFDTLPPNLTKIRVICEGRVNLDNSITLSEVI